MLYPSRFSEKHLQSAYLEKSQLSSFLRGDKQESQRWWEREGNEADFVSVARSKHSGVCVLCSWVCVRVCKGVCMCVGV